MTTLIVSTFLVSVVYFVFSLIARLHDCLITRYNRRAVAGIVESNPDATVTDYVTIPEIPAPIIEAKPVQNIPTSIRAIREYIRANALQGHIKEVCGKSVAKCSLAELKAAIA